MTIPYESVNCVIIYDNQELPERYFPRTTGEFDKRYVFDDTVEKWRSPFPHGLDFAGYRALAFVNLSPIPTSVDDTGYIARRDSIVWARCE